MDTGKGTGSTRADQVSVSEFGGRAARVEGINCHGTPGVKRSLAEGSSPQRLEAAVALRRLSARVELVPFPVLWYQAS